MRNAWMAAALALGLFALSASGADKSGVRPNVLSLPSGPGSISGLGEQFEPSLQTGSASYSVRLATPPGTAGLAPQLALTYDSGLGNGPLGIGWTLSTSQIQRQTDKGLPHYDASDRFLFNGQELVPVGGGVYRLKREGAFLRFRQSATHWEVDAPDGTLYRFGVSSTARQASLEGTFRWALESVVDVWGNRIVYTYETDLGQLYLTRIDYNARAGAANNRVSLEYEARLDALTDFRAGWGITTAKRLKRVRMFASGAQVRRYELDYDADSTLSRLAAVTMYGTDDATALPTLRLGYTGFRPGDQRVQALANAPPFSLRSANVELVDFDGDSLPDLLSAETGNHQVAYNTGHSWTPAAALASSPSVQLATNGVEVADVDGDGHADLVAKLSGGTADFYYFPNQANGRWETPRPFDNAPPFSFEDTTVRLIDFDGDGLTDVMQTTAAAYYYWRNNGDGTWADPLTGNPMPDEQVLFSDPAVRLADMNGDGLVDLVTVRPGAVGYWPNMGYGRWGARVPLLDAPDAGADASRVQLADLNGDGLSDLWLASGTQLSMWLQRGDGRFDVPIVTSGLPEANPATTVVRAADMNGSGTLDIVWNAPDSPTPWQYLDLVGGVRPNLLTTISNGLGRTISLAYASSGALYQEALAAGRAWTTRLPHPVQVVQTLSLSDGRGWTSSQTFAFADGYYDGATRQYRGFARTLRRNAGNGQDAPARTLYIFDVGREDEPRHGALLAEEVRTDEDILLKQDNYTYEVREYALGTDGRRVARAERRTHEALVYEGQATPARLLEEWVYDRFGNITAHRDWGVVEGEDRLAAEDERFDFSDFTNNETAWLLGRATRAWTTDAAGTRLAETRSYYDGDPFLGLASGQLGRAGALTRQEAWREKEDFVQTLRVARDAYGLVTAQLDARGVRHEVDYDTATHRFVVAERSFPEAGHALTVSATYEPTLGVVSSYTDEAGRTTRFLHNPLGLVTTVLRPGDADTSPSQTFDYVYGNPLSKVVWKERAGPASVVERHEWFDGLGRAVGTVTSAEGGRTLVSGMKVFGPSGQPVELFEPFFSSGFALPAAGQGASTRLALDALGRAWRTEHPDGTRSEVRYLPLRTETWDAEDLASDSPHRETPRTTRLSARGVTHVTERIGTRDVTTHFLRDALGRVRTVRSPLNRDATYDYDGLGRLTLVAHPLTGTTQLRYDEDGNLRTRLDARGARVETSYDGVGRPLTRQLLAPDGREEERTQFHYDAPSPRFAADAFAAGALTWVEDGVGQAHFRRDVRGRLAEVLREVDGKTFRLAYGYDNLDRLTRIAYPSGRTVTQQFGPRGLVDRIPGVLESASYNERGQVTERAYANGVVSTAAYDVMGRTAGLAVRHGTEQPLLSLAYAYDRAGNLLTVSDAVRGSGPLSHTRTYGYDNLYRLRSASAPSQTWSFQYDDAGNLLEQSGVGAYAYDTLGRATAIGGQPYEYDAAGNVTRRPEGVHTYDASGRLTAVQLPDGGTVRFRYDYAGRRVTTEVARGQQRSRTVYVDRVSEERDGQLVDFVFADGQRVAELSGDPAAAALGRSVEGTLAWTPVLGLLLGALSLAVRPLPAMRQQRTRLGALALVALTLGTGCGGCGKPSPASGAGVRFFHTDHLGSVVLQTDADGSPHGATTFAPYGTELGDSGGEPYGFTGKELERNSGLHHLEARTYDARIGRFLSADPLYLTQPERCVSSPIDCNLYGYARSAPSTWVDPSGTDPVPGMHLPGGTAMPPDMLDPEAASRARNPMKELPATRQSPVTEPAPAPPSTPPTAPARTPGALVRFGRVLAGAARASGPALVFVGTLLWPNTAGDPAADARVAELNRRLAQERAQAGAMLAAPKESLGKSISEGHAFEKHVVKKGEFKDLGITTPEDFATHIDDVVTNAKGPNVRDLSGGRSAYWDDATGTVVIRNPNAPDMGTAFRPTTGRTYFEGLE